MMISNSTNKTKWYWIGGVSAFLIVVGFIAMLFNAGGGSGGADTKNPITLKVWGTFEDSDNLAPFFADFEQKYTNVTVEYSQKNIEDYQGELLNAMATGTGPDLFMIHNDWLPKYKDKLAEAPKDIFTSKAVKDTFVDVVSADFVSDDKVYAVPLSVDSMALYYNRDVLGSAGIATPAKTWDDLARDVKKITIQTGSYFSKSGVALGTSANINRAEDILYLLMLQKKSVPYTEDFSQPTFDQAVTDEKGNTTFPASDAVSYYTNFANPNSDLYTWNTRSNYSIDAFANGDLGYMYGYSYLKDTLKLKAPNLNYEVAAIPQPSLTQNAVNFANYWGFAVSKQTKNTKAAWTLLKFMTSKEQLKEYYTRHSLPAARRDMISDQIDTDMGVFANANLTAKSFYKKDADKVDQIFKGLIDDVTLRGKEIENALANASVEVSRLVLPGEENQ